MRLPNTSSSFLNRLDSLGKVESTAEVRADTGCRGLSLKTIKWILKNNLKKKTRSAFCLRGSQISVTPHNSLSGEFFKVSVLPSSA